MKKSFKNLFNSRSLGEEKYVVFYSDDGKSKQYSDTILSHIPVLNAAYNDGKESKIKLESKYIDILPWIVSIYDDKSFRFILNTIIKTDTLYDMNIYNILEFINKYMVTSQNTIKELCNGSISNWFYVLIYECLYNSDNVDYANWIYNIIIEKHNKNLQNPYIKLVDDIMNVMRITLLDKIT